MAQNYILLERIELNASAASITFSNIPQTGYTDLKVVHSARTDRASYVDGVQMRFNGISTSTYSDIALYGYGTGVATNPNSPATWISAGKATAATATASTFGNSEVYIPNAFGATAKSTSADGVTENNSSSSWVEFDAGLWSGTSSITSVSFYPALGTNFVSGSTFSLYGIAAVGTTPAIAPKADGGNVIATDGTYWYHAFRTNGTFTPQVGLSCDVLTVAGGGGGGARFGGGGGAGGLLGWASQPLTTSSYAITVGAGGAGGPASGGTGTSGAGMGTTGNDSQFSGLTLIKGGGGGGAGDANNGLTGGSGGGSAGRFASTGGSGTSGQGNAGGSCNAGVFGGAGGGGKGAAGATGESTGNGGAGSNTETSYGAFTNTLTAIGISTSGYLAGGGGGAPSSGGRSTIGTGGSGGGGASSSQDGSTASTAGTAGTGGGGGGGAYTATGSGQVAGGNGGSGIVIIRYAV